MSRGEFRKSLPPRLLMTAKLVLPGRVVADIGSDHALLPCKLVEEGVCPGAVVGELSAGPLRRAMQAVADRGLANRIEVRQGDGLEELRPGEAGTVVIAGMGGTTVTGILERAGAAAETFERLVLQPMSAAQDLRAFVASRGWLLEEECVVWEDRYYVAMAVKPRAGEPYALQPVEALFGPRLLRRAGDGEVRDYLLAERERYARIAAGITGRGARALGMKKEYEKIVEDLGVWLQ